MYLLPRDPSLWLSAAAIVFNPTFWNIAARAEYNWQVITKLFGGNSRLGCYGLAVTIFSLGIIRDYLYNEALERQPSHPFLENPIFKYGLAIPLFVGGNTLVLSSMWALGVTGTYLGDYFGILMDEPVTSFPFNVSDGPMYHGSAMCFLATAIWKAKPAGFMLTFLVHTMYEFARTFEDPFTAMIYKRRDEQRARAKAEGKKAQ